MNSKLLFSAVLAAAVASPAAWAAGHRGGTRDVPVAVTELERTELTGVNALPIDELITTARKTEESTLEVPLAVTTFTADQIDRAQIQSLTDVAAFTPGFSFQNFFGQQLATPVIRGIAQIDIFGQPNVAVFVDGVYVSSRDGINLAYLNLERIEVVKGPQSALYGQNAFSGAINYVTKRPGEELETDTELTFGSDERVRARATVSAPIIDGVLSGSVGLLYDDFGGTYTDNSLLYDQRIGGRTYKTLTGSLFWTPTEAIDAQWNLYLSDDFIDPPAQSTTPAICQDQLSDPTDPSSGTGRLLSFCGDLPSVGQNDLGTIGGEEGQTRQVGRTTLNINWDLGEVTLSSLTGYSRTTTQDAASGNPGDADGTLLSYLTNQGAPGQGPGPISNFNADLLIWNKFDSEATDFTQELRLQTAADKRLRATGGLYFFTSRLENPNVTSDGVFASNVDSTPPADLQRFCPCIDFGGNFGIAPNLPPPAPPLFSLGDVIFGPWFADAPPTVTGRSIETFDQYAAFGALDFDLTDTITLRGEARYNIDEKEIRDTISGTTFERSDDWSYFTWRGSVDWAFSEGQLLYASLASGKKPGGFDAISANFDNNPGTPDTTEFSDFDPETNYTYELGWKGVFADGALLLESAVYYTDWQDIVIRVIQDNVNGIPLPIPDAIRTNAGDAEVKGAEFSARWQLGSYWNLGFGLSYTDAEYTSASIAALEEWPLFAPDGDVSGNQIQRQPEWQSNADATFTAPVNADWDWYVRGDANYQSKWYIDETNVASVPARIQGNLRLGLRSDVYTLEVWALNLNDNDKPIAGFKDVYFSNSLPDGSGYFFTELFPWRQQISHPDRRQVGVTLRGRF